MFDTMSPVPLTMGWQGPCRFGLRRRLPVELMAMALLDEKDDEVEASAMALVEQHWGLRPSLIEWEADGAYARWVFLRPREAVEWFLDLHEQGVR